MTAPFVSLIVPMANESVHIAECLEGLTGQDYPSDRFEILIVDGGSSDGSREIVHAAARRHAPLIRVLDNPRRITPVAFNIGIRAARGDLIGIISAHSVVASDYVSTCVRYLERTGADHVGGLMTAVGRTRVARAIAESTNSPIAVGGSTFHYAQREQWVESVYMGLYCRDVFNRVGLFDEELVRNQDDEFNYRLRRANGRHYQTPAIRSKYYSRATYASLYRQYFQYGLYKPLVLQKVPGAWRWRHIVPTLFVLGLTGGAVLAPFSTWARLPWSFGLAAYGGLVIVGAARVARKQGLWAFPLSALAFPTLHVAYGAGFACGLCGFRRTA